MKSLISLISITPKESFVWATFALGGACLSLLVLSITLWTARNKAVSHAKEVVAEKQREVDAAEEREAEARRMANVVQRQHDEDREQLADWKSRPALIDHDANHAMNALLEIIKAATKQLDANRQLAAFQYVRFLQWYAGIMRQPEFEEALKLAMHREEPGCRDVNARGVDHLKTFEICEATRRFVAWQNDYIENRNITIQSQRQKIYVYGDWQPWRLALDNIIKNAIKHGKPDSDITFNIRVTPDGRAFLSIENDAANNKPIDSEIARSNGRIWNKGTSDELIGGRGLGLYLVKMIIEHMGGRCELGGIQEQRGLVRRRVHWKNAFQISLPVAAQRPAADPPVANTG